MNKTIINNRSIQRWKDLTDLNDNVETFFKLLANAMICNSFLLCVLDELNLVDEWLYF